MKKVLLLLLLLPVNVFAQGVLTLTANNVTVHFGDEIPPLNYLASNFSYNVAVASGEPTISTTYTKGAAVGTYPVTLATNTTTMNGGYSLSLVAGTLTVLPTTGTTVRGALINNSPVNPPAGAVQDMSVARGSCLPPTPNSIAAAAANVVSWNCYVNGGRVSNGSYTNAPKMLHIPAGLYYFNAQLAVFGCCEYIYGDGPGRTILKLAPQSPGFQDTTTDPAPQFVVFQGRMFNQGFNTHFWNIGVETGPGNPGVGAFTPTGNNVNSFRNINVWSDDSLGQVGLYLFNAFPGPSYLQNIGVYGYRFCIQANRQTEYTAAFEGVTCENQTVTGVLVGATNTTVKDMFSSQSMAGVPAFSNGVATSELLNGELLNGSGIITALLQTSVNGRFVATNVSSTGYQHLINDAATNEILGTPVALHPNVIGNGAKSLFSTNQPKTLGLPATPTPLPDDTGGWTRLPYSVSGWQAALNACTTPSYYAEVIHNYVSGVPVTTNDASFTGTYSPNVGNTTIVIPDCVRHIDMNNMRQVVVTQGTVYWEIRGNNSNPPLVIEKSTGQNFITHIGTRTVVVKDMAIRYVAQAGAGDVFLDDVQSGGYDVGAGSVPFPSGPTSGMTTFVPGQHIWWRNMDNEAEGTGWNPTTVSLALVGSDEILTMTVPSPQIDPHIYVGVGIRFVNFIGPLAFLNSPLSTAATLLSISGNTMTFKWYGTHADFPATGNTAGQYVGQYIKVAGNGITLWGLNYKSEKANQDLYLSNSNAEIWGGFKYTVGRPPTPGQAIYRIVDTNFNTVFGLFSDGPQWDNFITETRAGVTRSYANPGAGGSLIQHTDFFYSLPIPGSTLKGAGKLSSGNTLQ